MAQSKQQTSESSVISSNRSGSQRSFKSQYLKNLESDPLAQEQMRIAFEINEFKSVL